MENPYWRSLVLPDPTYWFRITAFAVFFAALSEITNRVVRHAAADSSRSEEAFAALATLRADGTSSGALAGGTAISMIHSLVTSAVAVWAAISLSWSDDTDGHVAALWSWTLAFSQGYFIADGVLYGFSRDGELWVIIHHAWMAVAHHPIGELSKGCTLMGAGSCSRAVWFSAVGYFAEISTIFLNIRWYQHKRLKRNSAWYTLNSACLLITYPLTRVLIIIVLLTSSVWPAWSEYRQKGLAGLIIFTTVTYVALMLMSSYHFYTLISRGLGRALTFTPASFEKQKQ